MRVRPRSVGSPVRGQIAAVVAIGLAGWIVACAGDSLGTADHPVLPDVAGFLISDPQPAPAGGMAHDVVWVALEAGTANGGFVALVQASPGGAVSAPVIAGGVDPVALSAAVGDTVTIMVHDAGGQQLIHWQAQVKASKPPIIVRTAPTPRKRDVPLNASLLVVFSEPMDPATVTNQTVRLLKGSAQVAGQVALDATGLWAEFVPAADLDPLTDYTLEVTVGARDLSGEPLPAPGQTPFTTGADPAGSLQILTHTIGVSMDPDGYRVILDADTANALVVQVVDTVMVSMTAGIHSVALAGVSGNCVVESASTVTVTIPPGGMATAAFWLSCASAPVTGLAAVTTSISGSPIDPDGYRIVIDGDSAGASPVGIRDTVILQLGTGSHTAALSGVAPNCSVSPAGPVTFSVDPLQWVSVSFSVTCAVAGPSGLVKISTVTTGSSVDPDGYSVILDHDTAGALVLQANDSLPLVLGAGQHTLEFTGLAGHCTAASPSAVQLDLAADDTLVTAFSASCTPQGTADLAFVRDDQIYLVNPDGTGLVQLTSTGPGVMNRNPAWSPDGQRLAFSSNRGGGWSIYVMNADGSGLVRRTAGPYDTDPAWSPDGASIAFTSQQQGSAGIFAIDALTPSAPRVILNRPGYDAIPAWSPDGQTITFTSDWRAYDFLFDIYAMNADGSNVRPLIEGPFFGPPLMYYYGTAWSPDGQRLAVHTCSEFTGFDCYANSEIALAAADGSGLTVITGGGGNASPTWSPDGQLIVFGSAACDTCQPALRYVRVDGSGQGLILANGSSPAWRPE